MKRVAERWPPDLDIAEYPMFIEAKFHELDAYGIDPNTFVDTVLQKVYNFRGSRKIYFSSFNPSICTMLRLKQAEIPVMFLTHAGLQKVDDYRVTSIREAVRFAKLWKLDGIVTISNPLVMCPKLIDLVKATGLSCLSWGDLNNSPDDVKVRIVDPICLLGRK